ncbi:MAG: tyrosine--tRNA ligase [Bacteriovoracaceae bacterium]|nr:tyrosine--tRNA ligase [Bacteriovoracaceae bacterium]
MSANANTTTNANVNANPNQEREWQRQKSLLKFGIQEVTPEHEFDQMLKDSIIQGRPLRVKCGIDPTGFDVHLGHTVPYRKMRQFQDLGHTGVVIIGDYTAQIGDPSGKSESRAALTADAVKKNAENYLEQVYKVLDPKRTEVRYQTEWLSKVNLSDVITWAMQTTVAKLLSHDTFKVRIEQGLPLGLHELFYPVLQGMDSVYVNADVELGGSDQKFNVLMGRDYQKARNLKQQVAMLMPIVTGTCGTQKMSKSLNNYIAINDTPFDKFGKTMSIPDKLMGEWAKFIANFSESEYVEFLKRLDEGTLHPNEAKKVLAAKIVTLFHGEDEAKGAREKFEGIFLQNKIPEDAPVYEFSGPVKLVDILTLLKIVESNSEGRRLIKQSAVGIVEGDKISDTEWQLTEINKGQTLKIGKRKFLKIV